MFPSVHVPLLQAVSENPACAQSSGRRADLAVSCGGDTTVFVNPNQIPVPFPSLSAIARGPPESAGTRKGQVRTLAAAELNHAAVQNGSAQLWR